MPTFTPVTTTTIINAARNVRNIKEEIGDLEPDKGVLTTFLLKMNKNSPTDSVKFEWQDEDQRARWLLVSNNTYNTSATSVVLASGEGAKVVPGDILQVIPAATSGASGEKVLVTAVSTDTLTVTRGFGSSTALQIDANSYLQKLANAHAEGSDAPDQVAHVVNQRYSFTQYHRYTKSWSRQYRATRQYGDKGDERRRAHNKLMVDARAELSRQLLWGVRADTTLGGARLTTTDGLDAVITRTGSEATLFNAGGMLTYKAFTSFLEQGMRYGSGKKLLLSSGTMIRAAHHWAVDKLRIQQGTLRGFGLNCTKIMGEFGEVNMVLDRSLENPLAGNGLKGISFLVDLDRISLRHLKYGKQSCDIKLYEDVVLAGKGTSQMTDELAFDIGLQVECSRFHGKIYNITDFQ